MVQELPAASWIAWPDPASTTVPDRETGARVGAGVGLGVGGGVGRDVGRRVGRGVGAEVGLRVGGAVVEEGRVAETMAEVVEPLPLVAVTAKSYCVPERSPK
jgi:hypothetical protein